MTDELQLKFTIHALRRMFERAVSVVQVKSALQGFQVIEEYPADRPLPSRLVIGQVDHLHLHIVIADDLQERLRIVITVYEPDPEQWTNGLSRRIK